MSRNFSKDSQSQTKTIYFMMTPTHGNIGDQAIAQATLDLFNTQFNDYKIEIISDVDVYKKIPKIKKYISKDDVIFLHGGGNMGDLYIQAERERRTIIKQFSKNKIIVMPQTAFYSNSLLGRHQLNLSKKVYNNHPDLTLLAREKLTFKFMKLNFINSNVMLIPDVVFSLVNNFDKKNTRGNFITTCIRSDKESILKDPDSVLQDIKSFDENFFIYDTYVPRKISNNTRKYEVESFLNQISRSKLIITDRMHGMVMAAITRTPCIVTKSLDTKILGTYEWIKDLNYILLVKDFDHLTLVDAIDQLTNLTSKDNIKIGKQYYSNFRELIGL